MMCKIYKTLFLALLSIILWVGSLILAFFGGAIFVSIMNDKDKENEKEEQKTPGPGLRMNATSGHLRRPYNAETSTNWSKDLEVNLLFLRTTENHLNDQLRARGHVFLNDAYDALGMKRTSHGAIAGWLFRDNVLIAFTPNNLTEGDDIVLEFDYDGVIYNRLVVLD
jgi:hypothetical protein